MIRRLFSYIKPYKKIFALAVVALLSASVGEMILPVLLKSAIDDDVLPYRHRLSRVGLDKQTAIRLHQGAHTTIGGALFVPQETLADLSATEKEGLIAAGNLSRISILSTPAKGLRHRARKKISSSKTNATWLLKLKISTVCQLN